MTLLLLLLATTLCQEDRRAEAKKLEDKAARTTNDLDRERYLAEAWALRAEAFAEEGNFDAARDAWLRARSHGWTGPMPTGRRLDREKGTTLQDEDNPLGVPKPERPKDKIDWDYYSLRPYPATHNGVLHNLVGLPPFEQAINLPQGRWHLQANLDFTLSRFEEQGEGGTTNWKTVDALLIAQLDYALLGFLEVGVRIAIGEMLSAGDDVVIFQRNIQIVPSGERGLNLAYITPRVKVAFETPIVDIGALVEFKVPVAQEEDLLTASTFDLALGGMISKKFGEDWAVHAGGGVMIPIGDYEFFRDNSDFSTLPETNEVSSSIYFQAGIVWKPFEIFSLGLQFQGNSAVFENILLFDDGQYLAALFGRLKMSEDAFGSMAIGFGFGDVSPDFYLSFSFDFAL